MTEICSMTGLGVASGANQDFEIGLKVQSVNSRYLDINIRMPSTYNEFEAELRDEMRKSVSRGKVDAYLDIRDLREDGVEPKVNLPLAKAYLDAVEQLPGAKQLNRTVNAADLLSYPHLLKLEPRQLDDAESFRKLLIGVMSDAMKQLRGSREKEAARLVEDMSVRMKKCSDMLDDIDSLSEDIKSGYKQKIQERITELLESEDLDEGRLEQEVAFLVDRSDITEELVRFRSHAESFHDIISKGGEAGKKLDFLMQELNREINTIGSKSKSAEINRSVVDVKAELEKVREQVQNIE